MKDNFLRKGIKALAAACYRCDLILIRRLRCLIWKPPFELVGECLRCGGCCQTPVIKTHPFFFYFKTLRRLFLAWHRTINGFEFYKENRKDRCFYFKCTHWEPDTGLCDSYDSRPGMCRDYPRILLDSPIPDFIDGCGFRPVLRNAESVVSALESIDLPAEKLRELKRDLYLPNKD